MKDGFNVIGFIYRRQDKENRGNYLHIWASDDVVFRHISNVTWRVTTVALPTLLYILGFDSFAFITYPAVNHKKKGAITVHDIDGQVLRMFNRNAYSIERVNSIPELNCYCVVHNGQEIHSNVRQLIQTDRSALFASNHDMHSINIEFDKLINGTLKKSGLKRKRELVARLVSDFGLDLNQSKLS